MTDPVLPDDAVDEIESMIAAVIDHAGTPWESLTEQLLRAGRLPPLDPTERTTWAALQAAVATTVSGVYGVAHRYGLAVPRAGDPARDAQIRNRMRFLSDTAQRLGSVLYPETTPAPRPAGSRPSTRKIVLPWEPETLYPTPNLHGHGTRNLARAVAGDVDWRPSAASSGVLQALVGETPIAMVDLSPGREGEALMEILHQVVNPRTIQTMVGVCRLIWEKTEHQPFNRMATVRLGELARAAGYDPGRDRKVDPEIRRRLGRELKALTSITTSAAEGPFNRKTHQRPTAWVAPLLVIPAILLEQLLDEEQPAPREIDIMLGRNWATAYAETDLVQIAPGFMQLDTDSAIRLAWYYQTEFRYRMTDQRLAFTRPISNICESAGIDGGDKALHRRRFLDRLHEWHAQLLDLGVIGSYSRNPVDGENIPPADIWARGTYTIAPPQTIVDAYALAREKARKRDARAPRTQK